MPEINNDTNIVEALRTKTEKTDIKQYLKSTLGGYTKNSVQEYLSVLRKQQQAMADTFSRNQQALFEEKETLKKDNDALKTRLSQIESEYRNLFEALRSHELGDEEFSASDIVALKNNIAALEEELGKSSIEKSQLQQQIEQQNTMLSDLSLKLQQSAQEKLALKEMLKAEMLESKKQRGMVAQLSGTIEEKSGEIKFLNSLLSEGELAKLTAEVNDLTQQLISQTEMMASCNDENSLKSQTIETLAGENNTLKQSIIHLSKSLEEFSGQNDKLLSANQTLSDELEEAYKRSIVQIKEKSGISIDKLTAFRKLDEASAKITMLELQLQKYHKAEEMDKAPKSQDQSED